MVLRIATQRRRVQVVQGLCAWSLRRRIGVGEETVKKSGIERVCLPSTTRTRAVQQRNALIVGALALGECAGLLG